jgi:hypothetical protein
MKTSFSIIRYYFCLDNLQYISGIRHLFTFLQCGVRLRHVGITIANIATVMEENANQSSIRCISDTEYELNV